MELRALLFNFLMHHQSYSRRLIINAIFTVALTLIQPASRWMHWATHRCHCDLLGAVNRGTCVNGLLRVVTDCVIAAPHTKVYFQCAVLFLYRVTAGSAWS